MKKYLLKLANGENLTQEEAKDAMNKCMSGEATDVEIAGFLTALHMKGETIDEISGCAMTIQTKAEQVHPQAEKFIDIVGTGGDYSNSFNISTTSAFVIAAAGLPVAKHGNRSVSSKSGAGDVLEALGVKIDLEPSNVEACINETGYGFMFAPVFNKAFKYVGKARKELGFRTIFNIMGPMSNPSRAKYMLFGAFSKDLTEPLAKVLLNMGAKHAMVVSAENGMDEITNTGLTYISEVRYGEVVSYTIHPSQFGIATAEMSDIVGGDGFANAEIARKILSGEDRGPKRDIVLMNAGAALYVGEKAPSIEEGIALAGRIIDEGLALKKLEEIVAFTNQ
jgi:anthranilate phosphoribosyltransferase